METGEIPCAGARDRPLGRKLGQISVSPHRPGGANCQPKSTVRAAKLSHQPTLKRLSPAKRDTINGPSHSGLGRNVIRIDTEASPFP